MAGLSPQAYHGVSPSVPDSVSTRGSLIPMPCPQSTLRNALFLFLSLSSEPWPLLTYKTHSSNYVRTAARDQAWIHYTRSKLTEIGVQYVDVFDLIEPFRDCTQDGSHHILGVPEAVANHRIIPWICSLAPSN